MLFTTLFGTFLCKDSVFLENNTRDMNIFFKKRSILIHNE